MLGTFTRPLLTWYDTHGRKNFPWQHPRTPYRVWVSEIMLQQTQVNTVIPYFNRFMAHFPDIDALARGSEDEVLALWSGLGYYSRGRNLHQTAKIIQKEHQGHFPSDLNVLMTFPGIGASTAAAITSQAFNQPTAILDGNVKRVLSRYFQVGGVDTHTTKKLWAFAHQCMSLERPAEYTQAIMDLGATCCRAKHPECSICPLSTSCLAHQNQVVSNYPHKKIKKKIPKRHQHTLLIHNKNRLIYLEKQAPSGLWGGLWCPLSIDSTVDPSHYIEHNTPFLLKQIQSFMHIKHTFSHFQLFMNALLIEIEHDDNETLSGRWFSQEETLKLGLAKPIMSLLHQFYKNQ